MLDDGDVGAAAMWVALALLLFAAVGLVGLAWWALDWIVAYGHLRRWW